MIFIQTEIPDPPPIPCGSCRALARLRWRRHRHSRCRLIHRYRSLAGARQLPPLIFIQTEIPNPPPIPCGSCRALARLRWRWHRHSRCRLIHRYRSLAGARQLPPLIFIQTEIPNPPPIPCGSCRALARLRWRRHRHSRCRLIHRYRSLAGARQLPPLIFIQTKIPGPPPIPCGSCRALARLRWRWHRHSRTRNRFALKSSLTAVTRTESR